MDRNDRDSRPADRDQRAAPRSAHEQRGDERDESAAAAPQPAHPTEEPNPPHTTTGKVTSPKFGSAGSGGLEFEPGLDRD